ncbi:MAG: hypothetical protein QOD75_3498 [Blastocatellia bacterium]|jgi:hypothetical protein|nr:hypothetical protein [Blastocatellia bacterium]
MNAERWKYVLNSAIGTSHIVTATTCQDSGTCEVFGRTDGSEVLIAVVADGAGSAKCGLKGATLACSRLVAAVTQHLQNDKPVHDLDPSFINTWIVGFQRQLADESAAEGLISRDFASTMLAAVIGDDCGVFIQIGDGAIVIPSTEERDDYGWLFWPQQGRYANETNFVSDQAASERIEFSLINGRIDEVALFTDGLQSLALDYQSRQAHNPFFAPIFEWLRAAPEEYSEKYTASLSSFLNSTKINDCTDDDKTLLLATRRKQLSPHDSVYPADDNESQITVL